MTRAAGWPVLTRVCRDQRQRHRPELVQKIGIRGLQAIGMGGDVPGQEAQASPKRRVVPIGGFSTRQDDFASHGLMTLTPAARNGDTSRVATAKPRAVAMAAM